MSRFVRVLLLGASLLGTLGISGCYVEHRRGYYGHREYRCYGPDCHDRRHW